METALKATNTLLLHREKTKNLFDNCLFPNSSFALYTRLQRIWIGHSIQQNYVHLLYLVILSPVGRT